MRQCWDGNEVGFAGTWCLLSGDGEKVTHRVDVVLTVLDQTVVPEMVFP